MPKSHLRSYKVAWVNHTSLPIIESQVVPIEMNVSIHQIWCNIFPMNVTSFFVGLDFMNPWLLTIDEKKLLFQTQWNIRLHSTKPSETKSKPKPSTEPT